MQSTGSHTILDVACSKHHMQDLALKLSLQRPDLPHVYQIAPPLSYSSLLPIRIPMLLMPILHTRLLIREGQLHHLSHCCPLTWWCLCPRGSGEPAVASAPESQGQCRWSICTDPARDTCGSGWTSATVYHTWICSQCRPWSLICKQHKNKRQWLLNVHQRSAEAC